MVLQGNSKHIPRFLNPFGQPLIWFGRLKVSWGMIMGSDDRGSIGKQCHLKYFWRVHNRCLVGLGSNPDPVWKDTKHFSLICPVYQSQQQRGKKLSPQEKERLLDLFLHELRIIINQFGERILIRIGGFTKRFLNKSFRHYNTALDIKTQFKGGDEFSYKIITEQS